MYSIQRRNERFKIIYIYKIKEKLVPNISNKYGLTFKMNGRHGCKCDVPTFPIRGRARKARDSSFAWTACSLWNSLPKCIRNITGKDFLRFLRRNLIRSWPSTQINLGVVGPATHMIEMVAN